MLQYMDPKVLEMMCGYLKPVTYPENSYIVKEGEQLHFMLIITEGIIWKWTPTSTTCSSGKTNSSMVRKVLEKGDFYGEELLVWASPENSFAVLPISTEIVRCHTIVHAFVLTDEDLRSVVSKCGSRWNFKNSNINSHHDRWRRQVHHANLNRRKSRVFSRSLTSSSML